MAEKDWEHFAGGRPAAGSDEWRVVDGPYDSLWAMNMPYGSEDTCALPACLRSGGKARPSAAKQSSARPGAVNHVGRRYAAPDAKLDDGETATHTSARPHLRRD